MRIEDVKRENKRRKQEVRRRSGNRRGKEKKMKKNGRDGDEIRTGERKKSTNQEGKVEDEKRDRSVNSSKINHYRAQLTMKTYTEEDQYSIFNSTRNNPVTLMAPSLLPILKVFRLNEHALKQDMLSMLINTYDDFVACMKNDGSN